MIHLRKRSPRSIIYMNGSNLCSRIPDDKTVMTQQEKNHNQQSVTAGSHWLRPGFCWMMGKPSCEKNTSCLADGSPGLTLDFQIRPLTQQNLAWETQMSHQEHLFLELQIYCFQTEIRCKWAQVHCPSGLIYAARTISLSEFHREGETPSLRPRRFGRSAFVPVKNVTP